MIPDSIKFSADIASPSTSPRAGKGGHYLAELTCPVTGEPMHDAVVLLDNGVTYSRQTLVRCIVSQPGPQLLAPKSNTPLIGFAMAPNLAVRRMVADEAAAQGVMQTQPSASERGVRLKDLDAWDTQAVSLPPPAQLHLVKVQAHLLFGAAQIPAELLKPTTRELPRAWAKIIDEIFKDLPEELHASVKLACQNVIALVDGVAAAPPLNIAAPAHPAPEIADERIRWAGAFGCAVSFLYAAWKLNDSRVFTVTQQLQCVRRMLKTTEAPPEDTVIIIGKAMWPFILYGTAVLNGYNLAFNLRHRATRRIPVGAFCAFLSGLVCLSTIHFFHQEQKWSEKYRRELTADAKQPFNFHAANQASHLERFERLGILESAACGALYMVAFAGGFYMRGLGGR